MRRTPIAHNCGDLTWQRPGLHGPGGDLHERSMALIFDVDVRGRMIAVPHPHENAEEIRDNRQGALMCRQRVRENERRAPTRTSKQRSESARWAQVFPFRPREVRSLGGSSIISWCRQSLG